MPPLSLPEVPADVFATIAANTTSIARAIYARCVTQIWPFGPSIRREVSLRVAGSVTSTERSSPRRVPLLRDRERRKNSRSFSNGPFSGWNSGILKMRFSITSFWEASTPPPPLNSSSFRQKRSDQRLPSQRHRQFHRQLAVELAVRKLLWLRHFR